MKSYTDLEQSKKLAEILPLESADMHYNDWKYDFYDGFEHTGIYVAHLGTPKTICDKLDIPAWSLAALLDVLPDDCGIDKEDEKYVASYITSDECNAYTESNPVDACYKMILKLHELKML
jgi:hypothetical protein